MKDHGILSIDDLIIRRYGQRKNMINMRDVDGTLESFRCLNDLLGVLVVSLGIYSDEMLESRAFTCEEMFRKYNDRMPFDERFDINRIGSMLRNKTRSMRSLQNLRCMILRENVIYIYETALSEFKGKPYSQIVVSSPLISIAKIIRNTIAHKKLMRREGDFKKFNFDSNGDLKWNGVVMRKSSIRQSDRLTTDIISRSDMWKIINGIRDLIALEANGASEREIVSFCTNP